MKQNQTCKDIIDCVFTLKCQKENNVLWTVSVKQLEKKGKTSFSWTHTKQIRNDEPIRGRVDARVLFIDILFSIIDFIRFSLYVLCNYLNKHNLSASICLISDTVEQNHIPCNNASYFTWLFPISTTRFASAEIYSSTTGNK